MFKKRKDEPDLIQAARINNIKDFYTALARDPTQINVQGTGGLTSAHWAGSNRNLDLALLCLQNPYLDLSILDIKGRSAIDHAIDSGADSVRRLFQMKRYENKVPKNILDFKVPGIEI